MDLITVREVRTPSTRAELRFAPGELPLGGGTWLFSEPQPGLTGLVDLTTLGWRPLEVGDDVVTVAATCTIAELTRLPARDDWAAHPLVAQCANSLLASFKVWNVATVGGNVATSLPAGALTSLLAGLDATAVVWTPDGGERREPVARLVTGVRTNTLTTGEVLRSFEVPTASLRSRAGFRRVALSPLGRSGALVTSRLSPDGEFVVTITAGTTRPEQLRFDEVPGAAALAGAVARVGTWYDDPHGAPDWRRHVSALFAEELRTEALLPQQPPPAAPFVHRPGPLGSATADAAARTAVPAPVAPGPGAAAAPPAPAPAPAPAPDPEGGAA